MVEQIFLSPQVKQSMIISNKHEMELGIIRKISKLYISLPVMSPPHKMKILSVQIKSS